MQKGRNAAIIIVLVILIALSMTNQAYAATIYTALENGKITNTFEMGEKVRIIIYPTTTQFKVIVVDPEGDIRYQETAYTLKYDEVLSGITDKPGWWTVKVTESGDIGPLALEAEQTSEQSSVQPSEQSSEQYLTALNNVVPEVPLGTITATTTILLALGFYGLIRNKKSSSTKPN